MDTRVEKSEWKKTQITIKIQRPAKSILPVFVENKMLFLLSNSSMSYIIGIPPYK